MPQTILTVSLCTANFIFHLNDTRYFIGTAAHCFDNGNSPVGFYPACGEWQSHPLGKVVDIEAEDGTRYSGSLAYSSWLAMQAAGETDPDVCWNDLALIEIPAAAWSQIHPAVYHFGGPTVPPTYNALHANDAVHAALNSDYTCGYQCDAPVRAASGSFTAYSSEAWTLDTLWDFAGGSQGDSGGGLLGPDGDAWGVLSTGLQSGEFVYSNLWLDLAYMHAKVGWAPSLVTWSTFDASGNLG